MAGGSDVPSSSITATLPLSFNIACHFPTKMTQETYDLWSRLFRRFLELHSLTKVIDDNPPASGDYGYEKWLQDDNLVFCWILSTVSQPIQEMLLDRQTSSHAWTFATSREAWNNLEERFGSSSSLPIEDKNKIEKALQNSLNTVAIIAVLIATVSFTAGISPPGGVNSAETGMKFKGTSVVSQTTAFKIFIISNELALFASLAIVVILVSILPVEHKSLWGYFKVLHHAVCVSVAFMAVACVAAVWIIIPWTGSTKWIILLITSIGGGGTIVMILIGIGKVIFIFWKKGDPANNGNAANNRNADVQ